MTVTRSLYTIPVFLYTHAFTVVILYKRELLHINLCTVGFSCTAVCFGAWFQILFWEQFYCADDLFFALPLPVTRCPAYFTFLSLQLERSVFCLYVSCSLMGPWDSFTLTVSQLHENLQSLALRRVVLEHTEAQPRLLWPVYCSKCFSACVLISHAVLSLRM